MCPVPIASAALSPGLVLFSALRAEVNHPSHQQDPSQPMRRLVWHSHPRPFRQPLPPTHNSSDHRMGLHQSKPGAWSLFWALSHRLQLWYRQQSRLGKASPKTRTENSKDQDSNHDACRPMLLMVELPGVTMSGYATGVRRLFESGARKTCCFCSLEGELYIY